MDTFFMIFWLIWFAGIFGSFFVFKTRSGISNLADGGRNWRVWILPNIQYWLITFGKQTVWPIVLIVWAIQGRPECPWVAFDNIGGREARTVLRRSDAKDRGLL